MLSELRVGSELQKILWSADSAFALNPKLPTQVRQKVLEQLLTVQEQFKNHLFLLTSGTSGVSGSLVGAHGRWVALSREAMMASAHAVNAWLESEQRGGLRDVWLHALPDFHVGGLGIWMRAALSGARVVKQEFWDASVFVEQVELNRATLSALVPAQLFDLVRLGVRAPASLRAIVIGGGSLSPSLYQTARSLGWPLLPSYGMTEACSQIATAPLSSLVSLSEPELQILPHVEVRVGECLELKGRCLLSAYLAEGRIFNPVSEDGWFTCEDRGSVEEVNGARVLKLFGRSGEFFKISGENVELGQLRKVLEDLRLEMNLSADVTLLALPDARIGHAIHLVSDLQLQESEARRLQNEFTGRVLPVAKIRHWHRLPELPRTALGKLRTAECIARVQQGLVAQQFAQSPAFTRGSSERDQ